MCSCFMVFYGFFIFYLSMYCLFNKALSSFLIYVLDALWSICFWSKSLSYGCEQYFGFWVEDDDFSAWGFSALKVEE
jgi:hypothetical protein